MSENRKTVLHLICAIVAGLVATLLAHTHSFAQENITDTEPCSQQDYITYLDGLKSHTTEGTPLEHLQLAEAFMAKCRDRPETGRVALRAARNALDAGRSEVALSYFDQARLSFASFTQQNRIDYITTLILNGQENLAWRLRDSEVHGWLEKLDHDGIASVEIIRLRDGLIYKATFDAVDPKRRESLAWLALPDGAGFPATISLSSEDAMIALAKIRYGKAGNSLKQIKLRKCHGQVTLLSDLNDLSETKANTIAMAAAKAYLAAPDRVAKTEPGQPIASCFDLDRLFIAPDPNTAEPLS
jgi:hypothetical protein